MGRSRSNQTHNDIIHEKERVLNEMRMRIKVLLKDRRMSSTDISKVTSASNKTIASVGKWINKEQSLSIQKIIAISEVLDVSLDYMLLGHGPAFKVKQNLYKNTLTIAEKDLFMRFQNMCGEERQILLDETKKLTPKNIFYPVTFMADSNNDFEQAKDKMEEMMSRFGQNLKQIMKQKGVRQKDLSAQIGMHPSLFTRILKGERKIGTDDLVVICTLLNVLPSDLFFSYTEPEQLENFGPQTSDLIVHFRMLGKSNQGFVLALAKAIIGGIPTDMKYFA